MKLIAQADKLVNNVTLTDRGDGHNYENMSQVPKMEKSFDCLIICQTLEHSTRSHPKINRYFSADLCTAPAERLPGITTTAVCVAVPWWLEKHIAWYSLLPSCGASGEGD